MQSRLSMWSPARTPAVSTTAAVPRPEFGHASALDRMVFARRLARVAFGGVLLLTGGALALGAVGVVPMTADVVLLCGWLVALLLACIVAALAHIHARWREIGRMHDRFLALSIALPVAGSALVLPATLFVALCEMGLSGSGVWVIWIGATGAAIAAVWADSRCVVRRERILLMGVG